MIPIKSTMTAFGIAALLAVSGSAVAAATPISALGKAELAQLSPAKQKEVLSRATGGVTVRGVIETMLLNQISGDLPTARCSASTLPRLSSS